MKYKNESNVTDLQAQVEELQAQIDALNAALAAYPVGAIYMSTNATDPGTLFGGTWTQIQGRFLLAADDSHAAGSTGGEAAHTLEEDELPNIQGLVNATFSGATEGLFTSASGAFSLDNEKNASNANSAPSHSRYADLKMEFGGGQPHNNMPPYLSVYVWQRTA